MLLGPASVNLLNPTEGREERTSEMRHRPRRMARRRGGALVELAITAPLFALIFVVGVDFARAFYYTSVVATCALNGATQGSFATSDPASPYSSIQAAALADATNLKPQPTVTSTSGTDTGGNAYVEV